MVYVFVVFFSLFFSLFLLFLFLKRFFLKPFVVSFDQVFGVYKKTVFRKTNKNDHHDKDKEKHRGVEVIKEKQVGLDTKPRVVGFANVGVHGKFSAKAVKDTLSKIVGVNAKDFQEKGFFQAMEASKGVRSGVSKKSGSGGFGV